MRKKYRRLLSLAENDIRQLRATVNRMQLMAPATMIMDDEADSARQRVIDSLAAEVQQLSARVAELEGQAPHLLELPSFDPADVDRLAGLSPISRGTPQSWQVDPSLEGEIDPSGRPAWGDDLRRFGEST